MSTTCHHDVPDPKQGTGGGGPRPGHIPWLWYPHYKHGGELPSATYHRPLTDRLSMFGVNILSIIGLSLKCDVILYSKFHTTDKKNTLFLLKFQAVNMDTSRNIKVSCCFVVLCALVCTRI